ncbi:RNA-directed DNA polymerase from mobile element jockey-like [Elysia marginata]|uniref:RNA-directed DNA polymerase from mobile element jockey-like n=1 Tax=Elysia marginata TaxID=1093978 RepID=A0AAV4EPA3_9GAST|nr:RNA-directed DNA polymerase from mobile element jockey-like [Elysia marginata]
MQRMKKVDTLSKDTTALKENFDTWYLKIKTTKSVSTAFHLNNHEASKTLNIKVKNKTLPSGPSPKYSGVTLERHFNYRKYPEGCANKIAKRKLARTTWGTSQSVLRTSTLALCYKAAAHCAPVWTRCPNTRLVGVKLRELMRTIGGCLEPTPIQWLSNISLINCTSPREWRRCDTENDQKNRGHGRQHIP